MTSAAITILSLQSTDLSTSINCPLIHGFISALYCGRKKKHTKKELPSHQLLTSKRKFSYKNIDLKTYFKKCVLLENNSAFATPSTSSQVEDEQIKCLSALAYNQGIPTFSRPFSYLHCRNIHK